MSRIGLKLSKNKDSIMLVGVILLVLGIILPVFSVQVFSIDGMINAATIYADESPPSILASTVAGTETSPDIIDLTTVDLILEIDDGSEGSGVESVVCEITSISGDTYEETLNLVFLSKTGSLEYWGNVWDIPTLTQETKVKLDYTVTDKANHITKSFSYALISEDIQETDDEDETEDKTGDEDEGIEDGMTQIIDAGDITKDKDIFKRIKIPKPLELFNVFTFLGITLIIGSKTF